MSITSGDAMMTFGDELLVVSSGTLYTYSDANDVWIDRGPITSVERSSKIIIDNNDEQDVVDASVSANDLSIIAWEDSRGGIRYSVIDRSTGAFIISDAVLESDTSAALPRVVSTGNYTYVFYTIDNRLHWKRIIDGNPSILSSRKLLRNDVSITSGVFDVTAYGSDALACAYYNLSNQLATMFIAWNGEEGTVATGHANRVSSSIDAPRTIDIITYGTGSNLAVAWTNDSGSVVSFYDRSLTNIAGPSVIDTTPTGSHIAGCALDDSTLQYFTEISMSNATNNYIRTNCIDDRLVTSSYGPSTFMRSLGMATKPFVIDGSAIINTVHDSTLQSTYFTLRSSTMLTASIISKSSVGNAGGVYDSSRIPAVCFAGSGTYEFMTTERGRHQSKTGDTSNVGFRLKGLTKNVLDFEAAGLYDYARLGQSLILGGGEVSIYDGIRVVEAGFDIFPEDVSAVSGTGDITAGTYSYVVTYDWVDNAGQLHQSAPSNAVSTVLSASAGIVLTIPTLRVTSKRDTPVMINVWRTEDADSIYYKVTSNTSPTENDTTIDSITYTDSTSDADLITAEKLYTTSGELDNISPPGSMIIESHGGRIFLAGSSNRNVVWYSKLGNARTGPEFTRIGPSFSDVLTFELDPDDGYITGLASLDDKLIIFKRSSIYAIYGPGPDDLGNGSFGGPDFIQSDVGCINNRSIIKMPRGIMFESAKGIYLLTRDLSVIYIGAPVEAYRGLTITAAVLVDDVNQVRFTSSDGTTLVYDYLFDNWSVFTKQPASDGVIWNDQFVFLKSDGSVFIEDPDIFKDDGRDYRLKIGTAWISLQTIQGFQRVRRTNFLGRFRSAHKLRVKIYLDGESFPRETHMIDPSDFLELEDDLYGVETPYGDDTDVYGGTPATVYQFGIDHSYQKCQAVRFEIEDLIDDDTPSATGEGFAITSLELEIANKKAGPIRLPNTQRSTRS